MEKIFTATAEENQREAHALLARLKLVEAWENAGGRANLVGSLRTGLLMRHLDIDLHVYTDRLAVESSFAVMAGVAKDPSVLRIVYVNGMDTPERCLEWHLFCQGEQGRKWQIDVIHIESGSQYDGHFERVADRILAVMTPEKKNTILGIKAQLPDEMHVAGIECCRAVLSDNVKNYTEFLAWREAHGGESHIDWMP